MGPTPVMYGGGICRLSIRARGLSMLGGTGSPRAVWGKTRGQCMHGGKVANRRRGRKDRRSARDGGARPGSAIRPGMPGGRFRPLDDAQVARLHAAVLALLANTGLTAAPACVVDRVTAAGGCLGTDGRLIFPVALVERALAGLRRNVVLYARAPGHDLHLSGTNVYLGSGGAAPSVVDLDSGRYRDSTLRDLYDAARLVDALENVHFFSRSVVARDMPDPLRLDVNTAYACLAGTTKHVCVSASHPDHVRDIAEMCYLVAGSREAFVARPFLSFNVNHVVPPLRFAEDACAVIEQAVVHGIPVHANVFGQLGASSPVVIAGSIVQTVAETLAGMIFAWLVDPRAVALFGAKPMVTDLRTGGMSGGGGEQAVVMAAATQMARFYDLPSVSIAGATDSKVADAQSGYEKCLSVSLAAQAGSNLITQACGMQGSLMGCSFESYVIDNDMLGSVLSSLRPVQVDDETLAVDLIDHVVRTDGHYLGNAQTFARMETDFVYPQIADRRPPGEWEADGAREIRDVARVRARELLSAHYPATLDRDLDAALRARFDIRLPVAGRRHPPLGSP